ncbi:outer membrane biosynthesis protein TonB [Duganella sp. SG902]|uniref:hypothetical protein n=1 Tax=Duganella sp. SG902 TaxID=2587016 RepID=UPI00159D13F2|nr:hypothetical protein [Duganella sp. SG902]NVM80131.1 outer membrane biosynthesis protein TonB [Duganella sp. SG902]
MQGEEKRPSSSGRPSLLSSEPQADASHASILDGLERHPAAAAAVAKKRGRNKLALRGAIAGLLAVGAGVVAWVSLEPNPPLTLPAATQASAPAVEKAVAAAASEVPPAPVVATAANIVEDPAAARPPVDNTRSLKDMLNDTPAKPPKDELTAALEKPHAAPAKPKLAEHKKVEKPAKKPVQVAKKAETKPKAAPQDSDVALLAALMTHVQAGKPSKEPSTPAYQLKQCSRMNEAGAAQCRQHLCATTARKEPECKQPAAVKTAAEL